MKKTILLTLAVSTLLVLPAMAQLGRVWTDFQYYSTDLQNYLRNNLRDSLDINAQNALSISRGELNLPNPVEAGKQARQNILFFNTIPDKFENNQAVHSDAVSNEINRVITHSAVEGVLGRDGQTRMRNKLENTQATINNITKIANDSNSIFDQILNTITDAAKHTEINAVKEQSNLQLKVQSEQSKIMAETFAQSLQTNQFIQYTNLNLANISQQMEVANRARRVDTSAEAARLLRTTSQIDLFGRDINN
ncbi:MULTISPECIES: hypothetical protein [unclassified Anabaena]|uniref:hypothetical protein n=1 Tax=unclassified Anabaena TaxID=2619674 RepID=UPI000833428B|nr:MULTISPECIES: hypothetical protein [unclassified Anabaena]